MDALLKKLNYKKGPICVLNAPREFLPILDAWRGELPGQIFEKAEGDKAGFLLVFAPDAAAVAALVAPLSGRLPPDSIFWVAFPKQSSKAYASDINRDKLWKLMTPLGFRPNRNVALDEDWSALRFAAAT